MQTVKTPTIALAGTQTPLLESEQVRTGVILAGILLNNIWEVIELEGTMMTIQMLPRKVMPEDHAHSFTKVGEGGMQCVCGVRKQEMRFFLPVKPGKARIHIIAPKDGERVMVMDPWAVYAGLVKDEKVSKSGTVMTFSISGKVWSAPLPILPELHKVWELPVPMRKLLEGAKGVAGVDPEPSEF